MDYTANPSTEKVFIKEELDRIVNLIRAARLWPGKDSYSLDGELGAKMTKVRSKIESAENQLLDNSEFCRSSGEYGYIQGEGKSVNPMNAKKDFKEALNLLESMKDHKDWDENKHIKDRIYNRGDGTNYESGAYRRTGVSGATDALRELIQICDETNADLR